MSACTVRFRESGRVRCKPFEAEAQLRACCRGVEIVGNGGDSAIIELELSSRIPAGCEQKLGAPERRMPVTFVELDLRAREKAESCEAVDSSGAFQRPERFADRVLAGYDAARTAATT